MTTTATFDPVLALARQSMYRFAAVSLVDPRTGSWQMLDTLRNESLPAEAAALVRSCDRSRPAELALGELPPDRLRPEHVLSQLPRTAEEYNREYERTFGLLVTNECPPYETEYIPERWTFQRSNALADVAGFYRAFGFAVSTRYPDRPDHVVLELEFMALLIGLERQADRVASPAREERLSICRDAQRRFLREHLAWWTPAFARVLARAHPDRYYAAAGEFLAALIPVERGLLDVEPPRVAAEPSRIERPDSCEGCELASH